MSIWCSWDHIGSDPRDAEQQGGQVRSYAHGFSNHYPTTDGEYEQPAAVALAHIAPWCVPGHGDPCTTCVVSHDHPEVGPWLRMEVASHEHSWKDGGIPTGREEGATIVMDEDAVRALRDDLTRWLALPKLQPDTPLPPGNGDTND